MTTSGELKGLLGEIIDQRQSAYPLTGKHYTLPPPQPGLLAGKPTQAQGRRVDFANRAMFPSVATLPAGLTVAPGNAAPVQTVVAVTWSRSLAATGAPQSFYAQSGGSTPDPHARDKSPALNPKTDTTIPPAAPPNPNFVAAATVATPTVFNF